MGLWIIQNEYAGQVVNDLQTVCPDPNLAVDLWAGEIEGQVFRGTGDVTLDQSMGSVGCELIASLVRSAASIAIRGAPPTFALYHGSTEVEYFGANAASSILNPVWAQAVYSITGCGDTEFSLEGLDGSPVLTPPHVVLFHELAEIRYTTNFYDDDVQAFAYDYEGDAGDYAAAMHAYAVFKENQYRDTFSLPHRRLYPRYYWCGNRAYYTPDDASPMSRGIEGYGEPVPPEECSFVECYPGGLRTGHCFVATAACGSPVEPEVEFLRRFRDDILIKTRDGRRLFDEFYKRYYQISPIIVDMMEKDPAVKGMVRWGLVNPIVRFLQIAYRFPDASIDQLEEPWRSFIHDLRESLERWSIGTMKNLGVELPVDFTELSPQSTATELALILKFALRNQRSREAYLRRLEELGRLPLNVSQAEGREIAKSLSLAGRPEGEINRILGKGDNE